MLELLVRLPYCDCYVFSDIFIGFEQQRYTVFEADAYGDSTLIPVFTANGQEPEIQFNVISQILDGSAEEGSDYDAMRRITWPFLANEQSIDIEFVLLGDDIPEDEEEFTIELELTTSGAPRVMIGGGLFGRTTVVIIDDDG